MTSGARVTIGGALIASGWDGSELVAIDGITIKWGRTEQYADPDPSVLTLSLIDRTGRFISDDTRVGQEIIVTMVDPERIVFRGAIAKPKARRAKLYSPQTERDEVVWIVTLTASDPTAALGMAVFAGDAQDGWVEGAGGWAEHGPAGRLQAVYDAGASGMVDGFEALPEIGGSVRIARRIHGQSASDARTALQLVQQVYRAHPFGTANYDPNTHTVRLGGIAAVSQSRLTYVGGVVRLALDSGVIVPASKVGAASYELQSMVDAAIDVVQVSYYWYGKDPALSAGSQKRTIYTQGFIEGRTARNDPRSRRVLKVDTEWMTFDPTEFDSSFQETIEARNRFPAWLRAELLAVVNRLNGQLRMPSLTFDAKRLPLPVDLEAILYTPSVQSIPLYFAGSIFNGMTAVGPQFQIIGGTLSYNDGWRHEVTVCGLGATAPSTLTVQQIVTNDTPTLGDFDPDISLADLGYVSNGLA